MASLLLAFHLLLTQTVIPNAGTVSMPLLQSIDLDAEALLADPSLLAADTLALRLESRREAYFKLSERGEVLAAGKLLPGSNHLRFTRPGISARSQSLFFILDLLEDNATTQKFLRLQVTVEERTGMEPQEKATLSGSFRLEMYHSGNLIGFRKKRMEELLKLKTGLVVPVPDPGRTGSAIRNQPASYSVSVLTLGMALAKYLAGKKTEKTKQEHADALPKKRLVMTIPRQQTNGEKREIPIIIELRVE